MFRRSESWRLLVMAAVVSVAGCGGPAYEFAPVEGKVTLNGQPLVGVIVRFYPETESTKQPPYASGITDENGMFQLSVAKGKPGALVGPNIAVVRWPVRDRDNPPPVPDAPIPVQYTVATQSPLRFDVKAGPVQTFEVALKDE